jgi:DNA-binding transcriptional MerR regulator
MGVGRLSLRQLCSEAGLSLEAVTAFLQEEGFSVSPENTIRELAQQKQMAPVDFKDFLLGEQQRTTDE